MKRKKIKYFKHCINAFCKLLFNRRICARTRYVLFMFRSHEIWTPRKPWVDICICFAYICYILLLFQEYSVISVCVEYLTKLSLTCNEQTGRITWLLKQFYYFFYTFWFDLTWCHDFRKTCNHIWSSQKVCKVSQTAWGASSSGYEQTVLWTKPT